MSVRGYSGDFVSLSTVWPSYDGDGTVSPDDAHALALDLAIAGNAYIMRTRYDWDPTHVRVPAAEIHAEGHTA